MFSSSNPAGFPRNRRTSVSQQNTVLNGPFKEVPNSPERRMLGGRVGTYFSHKASDSISATTSVESLASGSPTRTPERRGAYKARRSSFGEQGSPLGGEKLPQISGSPVAVSKRHVRIRRRHIGRYLLGILGALFVFALYRHLTRRDALSSSHTPTAKPKKPPKKKPKVTLARPTIAAHNYDELSKLRSTLAQPHTATIAAVIICEDETTVNLRPLLASLEYQTLPPSEAIVLCELDSDELLSTAGLTVSISTSDTPETSIALLETAHRAHTDFLFVMDADVAPLAPEHLDTLVRAAGTIEYSAALLTTAGLQYTEAEDYICLPWTSGDAAKSVVVHLPEAPYLVQRSWLATSPIVDSGLHLDVPHGHAIALALWQKAGIGSFALPLAHYADPVCEETVQLDVAIAATFLSENAVGMGQARSSEEYLDTRDKGVVAFVVGDAEELQALSSLACAIAEGSTAVVKVYIREGAADTSQIFCILDIQSGTALDAATADVLIYGSLRAAPDAELRALNAWTSDYRGKPLAAQPGPTAIFIPADFADELKWAGTLDIDALRQWHKPRIDLAVVTNNRPESLARLLRSLTAAEYYGDRVTLSISLEQTADQATHRLIEVFDWPHGALHVRHRVILGGLMPAITEAWYPASNDSYGVFLEDDVELSPLFYGWLKYTILKYRYSGNGAPELSKRLYGVSMYQQKANELKPEGRRPFDAHVLLSSMDLPAASPYLSQVPCSWGAVYFPEVWREFHLYLALRLSEVSLGISDVVVPDVRSNKWPRSWKKYFVELVYARGYTMLYPNYPEFMSFSTNHLEAGTHIRKPSLVDAKRRAQFEVPLAPRSASLLDGLPHKRLPGWSALPVIDLWGSVTTEDELVSRGWSTIRDLGVCTLPSRPPPVSSFDAREILCEKRGRT